MTVKQTILAGGVVGLLASGAVLDLLWFHVSGVLGFGNFGYRYILFPFWPFMVVGWRSTALGITITVLCIAMNCVVYAAIALLLRGMVLIALRALKKNDRPKTEIV
jgi:hypothetical protein